METWKLIQKTIDYIEDNIEQKITIEQLADMAHLSPFYYQRIFKRLVGRPVMEYIRLRRLAKSEVLLSDKNNKIIDVAFAVGFENHETYTRTFKNVYDITPDEFRREGKRLENFMKPEIALKYTIVDENVPLIVGNIVLEVRRKTLQKERYFAGISLEKIHTFEPEVSDLAELWDNFHSIKGTVDNITKTRYEIGVNTEGSKKGYAKYMAGIEVTKPTSQKEFENHTVMPGEYIVCKFEAENFRVLTDEIMDKAMTYMYMQWLPSHNLKMKSMYEMYPSFSLENTCMEIWFGV